MMFIRLVLVLLLMFSIPAEPAERQDLSVTARDVPRSARIAGPKNLTDLGKGKYRKWAGCGYSIDWGDGSRSPVSADCAIGLSHTFRKEGTYRIVAKIFHLAPSDSPVYDWVGEAQFVVK